VTRGPGAARAILAALALTACTFPQPSAEYSCRVTADCDSGRVCEGGYCVVSSGSNGTPGVDAGPVDADAMGLAAQCMAAGYTQLPIAGGLYRAVSGARSWLDAQLDCKDDVPGKTHLIVLSTTAEVAYAAAQPGWIGLSDRTTEGVFVTVTGEAGDQRPFDTGQPDNGDASEDCVESRGNGRLNDDQCGLAKPYVCECDGRPSMP
jgi:hypothetical protein